MRRGRGAKGMKRFVSVLLVLFLLLAVIPAGMAE